MNQTAVEWFVEEMFKQGYFNDKPMTVANINYFVNIAKEMEAKQLFLASNTSAKEAYKAGQQTMHCGCYEISDALTYKEWLYENFKSEE
jgi:hypothetical protein